MYTPPVIVTLTAMQGYKIIYAQFHNLKRLKISVNFIFSPIILILKR